MTHLCARSVKFLAITLLAMTLAACVAVGPDYVPPQTASPAVWNADLQGGLKAGSLEPQDLAQWWRTLNDPVLSQLIAKASAGNRDLAVSQARVREARARRGIAVAAWFPTLDAKAANTHTRSSAAGGGGGGGGAGVTRELYSAEFDAQWEIDLFGATRRSVEAASADLQATSEQLHDVQVSLLAEVALNYVDVRTFQQRLIVAQRNLYSQSQTYDIAGWRNQAGLGSALDTEQAKSALDQVRAQLPSLRTGLAQALNRIAVLTGAAPGAVDALLTKPAPVPVTPPALVVGVPADVLRQRPDVRRAERQLAAQAARVGVASAAQYPDLSLIGSIGVEALTAGKLFTTDARSSIFGASLVMPIFNGGRIRQNIAVQNALQEQALLTYESTVLTALQDVENALVAYVQEQNRRDALRKAAASSQRASGLADVQYESGLIDFQVVLNTQRSMLSAQDQLAVSEGEVTANLVRLYKALGGGWVSTGANDQASLREPHKELSHIK